MDRGELGRAVAAAALDAVDAGELAGPVPDAGELGWALTSPVAIRMAAASHDDPRRVAAVIARRLPVAVRVAADGMLVFAADPAEVVDRIRADRGFGATAGVPASAAWPDRPRTFANKGFAVRFAYARARAVRRWAAQLDAATTPPGTPYDSTAGAYGFNQDEAGLARVLGELPGRAALAVRKRDAGPLRRYLERAADAYHDVHERYPALPKGDEPAGARHRARVRLAEAAEITFENGLLMLGETPRERI